MKPLLWMTRQQNEWLSVLIVRMGCTWCLATLCLMLTSLSSNAAQSGDFIYTSISSSRCSITGYTGAGGKVEIPFSFTEWGDTYIVSGIEDRAFKACTNLTGVTIPGGVSSIGYEAFSGCFRLASVIIPARVTTVSAAAFKACSNLTSVTISAQRNYTVDRDAFADCTSLSKVYFLGDCPSGFDYGIFTGSTNVTVFYQPQKTGWSSTFGGRPAVQLPFNYIVTVDGKASFCGFGSSIAGEVTVPAEVGGYPVTDIGGQALYGCIGMTRVSIPTSITSIGTGAFFGCTGLTGITIPDSVTNIASYAFADCVGLRSVEIGNSVISIGAGAFSGCSGLTGLTIPASVESIGDQAFDSCSGAGAIAGLGGVTTIGSGAFSGCGGLTGIAIPDSVTNIGWWAFSDCAGLAEVSIPASVAVVGDYAFSGCASLTGINVNEANANYSSVDGVLFNKDKTLLIRCPGGKTGNYTIPAGIAVIENEAVSGCASITSVMIPAGVTNIGGYAFEDCTILTAISVDPSNPNYRSLAGILFDHSITTLIQYPSGKAGQNYVVPPGVSTIGDCAFKGCAGLTEVSIPASVTSIGNHAFLNCAGLTAINVDPANANYSSEDGVLCGFGPWGQPTLIQCPGGKVGDYTIPSGIQAIGECAFFNCKDLTGVSIPGDLIGIGDYAFFNCTALTNITLPSFHPSGFIGNFAFFNCTGLTSVTIPSGVWSIGDYAFLNCSGLTSIEVDPNNGSFSSVGGVLFDKSQTTLIQCPGGKAGSCFVPVSVTRIEDNAFFNCAGLTAIDVDENNAVYSSDGGVLLVKSETTLIQCPGGKTGNYLVPSSVFVVKSAAFINCSLTTATIPASVNHVGNYAFGYCADLDGVYFKGDVPGFGWDALSGTSGAAIYYLSGAVGFDQPVAGQTPVLWNPHVNPGSGFGCNDSGQFGFTVLGTNNMAVTVEACTNLPGAVWLPVATVTLANGMSDFTDAASTNHPARYYRFRMP